jgi:hypothetical protein
MLLWLLLKQFGSVDACESACLMEEVSNSCL